MHSTQTILLFSLFILSCFFVGFFRRHALNADLIDYPNHRSSHHLPTPRGGGIVFVLLWLALLSLGAFFNEFPVSFLKIFLPGGLLIAVIGYLDDHFGLPITLRLFSHLIAATLGVLALGGMSTIQFGDTTINLGALGTLLTIFATTWSINLFNFMDGLDGLATIEAIFLFLIGGLLLWLAHGTTLAILSWALVALLAGFLVWNWPRAKIFMGDVGSTFLGFLVPLFAIAGEKWFNVSILLWLMLYSVFIFDASITLLRRILAKQQWFHAHRLHAFQRLHQSGWSAKKILFGIVSVNLFILFTVYIATTFPFLLGWSFLIDIVIILAIYFWIERKLPMFHSRSTASSRNVS